MARLSLCHVSRLLHLLMVLRKAIGLLLRLYSYLYHLILSLFLLGLGIAAYSSTRALRLGMLPWDGEKLTQAVLALGVIGLVCLFGAVSGLFRWLFPIWTLAILVLMVRGFFLSSYSFSGPDPFKRSVWLTIGALVAFLSSLTLFTRRHA
ncbi:MAG: hypothetical protein ACR2NN_01895 [Bryobacteraceae bacterium]